jgi:hypothetical protein
LAVLVFSYHLLISLSQTFDDFSRTPTPGRNLIVLQSEVIDPTDAVLDPGAVDAARELGPEWVARVSPIMFRSIRVDDHLVHLRAAPLEDWIPLYQMVLQQGRWPAAADEIAAGEGTARANHWAPGSILRIYGRDFRISAIFTAPGTSFASIWIPLERARQLFGEKAPYQGMYILPAVGADVVAVRDTLQDVPAIKERYTVFFEDSYARRNNQAQKDVNSLAKIAAGLALTAVVLGVFNATRLSLVERSREIGCLFAIGFSRLAVHLFLLVRGQILTGMAYLCGLGAAWGYMRLGVVDNMVILGFPLSFDISLEQAAAGAGWTILLAAAGVWLSVRGQAAAGAGSLLRGES